MGVVGDAVGLFGGVPYLLYVLHDLAVVAVYVGEVYELIVSEGVDGELLHHLGRVDDERGVDARHIEGVALSTGDLQMYSGIALSLYHLAEPLESLYGLFNAAEAVDEGGELVDHEHGTSVDLIVVLLAEVLVHEALGHSLEALTVDAALPDHGVAALGVGELLVPEVVSVVVSPHNVELHLVAVRRLEEAVVEAALKEGTSVEPVPVVDEDVYAVLGSLLDLHLHYLGIGLVYVAPERLSGPGVPLKLRLCGSYRLPFALAVGPEHTRSELVSCVGWPHERRYIILFHNNLQKNIFRYPYYITRVAPFQ